MTRPTRILTAFLLGGALLLAACATTFDIGSATREVAPAQAAADIGKARGKEVAWGGVIVSARNLTDSTQFEILGYPLDDHNRPTLDAPPTGRFVALHPGYLETASYAQGRVVTVVGTVTGTRAGTVGDAPYVFPVVGISRIHLWPSPEEEARDSRVHFGVGIGIGIMR